MHRASSLLPLATVLALASLPAASQTAPRATPATLQPLERQAPAERRPDQRIERIVIEDAGSRIDELRYGGQTQSITVQPKTATPLPHYQVQPDGQRVWQVLNF